MTAPVDLRVPRGVLDEPDPEQLVWKVIEPAWNAVDVGGDPDSVDAQLAGLTPGQRALFAISWCVSEVENGGFEQFFANPAGVLAREAREGFVRVREVELASVVDQVAALLPGEWPARERRMRNFQLRQLRGEDEERVTAFEPYDQAFYNCLGLEELTGSCAAYVLGHPEEFVRD